MTIFDVGDRVKVLGEPFGTHGATGTMVGIDGDAYSINLDPEFRNSPSAEHEIWSIPHNNPLERIDDQVDRTEGADSAGGAGVPGSPPDDPVDRDAGQHPAESTAPPVAPVAMATFETLTVGYITTRRMRVNVTKNTKGYSYDRTVEITTDDPDIELSQLVSEELRLADNTARDEIEQCEYIDANGRPGADDDVALTQPL